MIKNKCAIVTVIYPQAKKFINAFLKTLDSQTNKKFDLIVYNDGFKGNEKYFRNLKRKYLIFSLNQKKCPSELRSILIKKALDLGYKKLIFADIDDKMSKNRVQVVSKLLSRYDIVVNDINLCNQSGKRVKNNYFSKRIKKNSVFHLNKIINGNFMGFTNTGAKSEIFFNKKILKSIKTKTYDWYLWSQCLQDGAVAFFTNKTLTNYRVNVNNATVLPHQFTKKYIKNQIDLRVNHYRLMSQSNNFYKKNLNQTMFLNKKIKKEKYFKEIVQKMRFKKNNLWCEI